MLKWISALWSSSFLFPRNGGGKLHERQHWTTHWWKSYVVSTCPKPYATFIEELNVVDGLLLQGHRVVMPPTLRPEMLGLLHEGHLGIEKCKQRARDTMYWPAMNADIEQLLGRCEVCLTYHNAQSSEPILHHDKPLRPWACVGMDILYIKGKTYLLNVDAYSHFPEVALLSSETCNCAITHYYSVRQIWNTRRDIWKWDAVR